MRPARVTTSPEYDIVFRRTSYDALLEAFLSVDSAQWLRRAEELEAARPRLNDPTEFRGRATQAGLLARGQRLTEAAAACRRRATFVDATRAIVHDTLADLGGPAA